MRWSATRHLLLGFFGLFVLLGGFIAWSTLSNLSGAIIASGQVEVDRNRQIVQHVDGGVVAELIVDEGDMVAEGDILLRLDDTLLSSELAITEAQLFELMARRGRLEAERDNTKSISFEQELLAAGDASPEVRSLIDGQTRLFEARLTTLSSEFDQLRKRRDQIDSQIEGIVAQQEALAKQSDLLAEELKGQQDLLKKGLTRASSVLALQRQEADILGNLGNLTAAKAEAEGRITELDIEIIRRQTTRREEAISQLRELQFRENTSAEQRRSIMERLARMEIRAPVSGIVYGLTVFGARSVIRPADPVLYLVPQDRPLVIASQVEPIHIDQVYVGQEVIVRLAAFDQRTTPEMFGKVIQLSADAFTNQATQASFYRAEIVLNPGELDKLPAGRVLIPGMPVESFIRTEDRSPLAYLTKPLTDYFARALRES